MKKLLFTLFSIGAFSLLLLGFTTRKNQSSHLRQNAEDSISHVQFQVRNISSHERFDDKAVRLKVVDVNTGKIVYHSAVKLIRKKSRYVTPLIELKSGKYRLEEFSVVAKADENVLTPTSNKENDFVILPAMFQVI